jgi:hypothetical protein
MAARRAVVLEPDPRNVVDHVATVLPSGLLWPVTSEPTTLAAVDGAAQPFFTQSDQLATLLEQDRAARTQAGEALLWRSYTAALFFAARGSRPQARRAVARALERAPSARELAALRDALAAPGEGPLDVTPFLPAAR